MIYNMVVFVVYKYLLMYKLKFDENGCFIQLLDGSDFGNGEYDDDGDLVFFVFLMECNILYVICSGFCGLNNFNFVDDKFMGMELFVNFDFFGNFDRMFVVDFKFLVIFLFIYIKGYNRFEYNIINSFVNDDVNGDMMVM